jgi:hypothetical protein
MGINVIIRAHRNSEIKHLVRHRYMILQIPFSDPSFEFPKSLKVSWLSRNL